MKYDIYDPFPSVNRLSLILLRQVLSLNSVTLLLSYTFLSAEHTSLLELSDLIYSEVKADALMLSCMKPQTSSFLFYSPMNHFHYLVLLLTFHWHFIIATEAQRFISGKNETELSHAAISVSLIIAEAVNIFPLWSVEHGHIKHVNVYLSVNSGVWNVLNSCPKLTCIHNTGTTKILWTSGPQNIV